MVDIHYKVGVRTLPSREVKSSFDVINLVGGLFFTLILHQLLPVFISVSKLDFVAALVFLTLVWIA